MENLEIAPVPENTEEKNEQVELLVETLREIIEMDVSNAQITDQNYDRKIIWTLADGVIDQYTRGSELGLYRSNKKPKELEEETDYLVDQIQKFHSSKFPMGEEELKKLVTSTMAKYRGKITGKVVANISKFRDSQ